MGEEAWKALEQEVRRLASYIWDRPAGPARVNGVDLDCVLKLESDHWICVEVTTSRTLEKLREDLAKFGVVRLGLMQKNIYAKCYFVMAEEPTPAIKEAGEEAYVTVLSVSGFASLFFDFETYRTARLRRAFGSAVDPVSGSRDDRSFVPVRYQTASGATVQMENIAAMLAAGRRLVLLGEFGTGKSRCFQEIFQTLARDAETTHHYPLAINLRDNWGVRRGHEILRRHFDDLGLSEMADRIVKTYDRESIIFLLDGFDEIGSQSWSDNQNKLRLIRQEALAGVKDLIQRATGGVIVSGREHYFNSNEEMFAALGLDPARTELIRCQSEFTHQEMEQFLARTVGAVTLPRWLPRRPLICQTIASLSRNQLDAMFCAEAGDVGFFEVLLDAICKRESNIGAILEPDKIKHVLRRVARVTRSKLHDVGPITIGEINRAFEHVLGTPPVDESAVMLQRLPGLGRLAAETTDRVFIDKYILDGLRAMDIIYCAQHPEEEVEKETWINPLQELGQSLVARAVDERVSPLLSEAGLRRLTQRYARSGNRVAAGDVVASLLRTVTLGESVDFGGLRLEEIQLGPLDCSRVVPHGLELQACVIEELRLPAKEPRGTRFEECSIGAVRAASTHVPLPRWLVRPTVDEYRLLGIEDASLTIRQRIFVSIIRRTFFKSSGSNGDGFWRALDQSEQHLSQKILKLLLDEKIIKKVKKRGYVAYEAVRTHSSRMRQLMSELNLSKDPLWKRISEV